MISGLALYEATGQVYHTSHDDPHMPMNYMRDIENIAHIIGKMLVEHCDADGRTRMSTIIVDCVKEKLGTVRVYCNLASESLLPENSTCHDKFLHLLDDARHYRDSYKTAIWLWPYYDIAIRTGASYPMLLLDDLESFLNWESTQTPEYIRANVELLRIASIILTEEHEQFKKANQGG